ncbi:MAG: hypothetical protein PHX14_08435 [Syntrophomonadaceae bacterium]|nr:hypothetical protein [Syntrophomonadaceae bacterium]
MTRPMSFLEEAMTGFPDRSFLIHIKAGEAQDGERLAVFASTWLGSPNPS